MRSEYIQRKCQVGRGDTEKMINDDECFLLLSELVTVTSKFLGNFQPEISKSQEFSQEGNNDFCFKEELKVCPFQKKITSIVGKYSAEVI